MKNSSISPSTIKPNMPHSVLTLAICNEDELGVLFMIYLIAQQKAVSVHFLNMVLTEHLFTRF